MKKLRLITISFFLQNALFHSIFTHASMLADPRIFRVEQPDGNLISLRFHGDASYNFFTDNHGYTVVDDLEGYKVYAMYNTTSNDLSPTSMRVGEFDQHNLKKHGIHHRELPSLEKRLEKCGEFCTNNTRVEEPNIVVDGITGKRRLSAQSTKGVLKNLVVLICFADDEIGDQPPRGDYVRLFNGDDRTGDMSGSVRDVFDASSYGNLKLESEVTQWIKISKTQEYYANKKSGLTRLLHDAMTEALERIDSSLFNWLDFDQDRDGNIDAISFLHSGYGSEFGGTDCYGTKAEDRIWSHKWAFAEPWKSRRIYGRTVSVSKYHISPAKYGTCGNDITHIGVVAHETGHFLGLDDFYDGTTGNGIGNYGLMGNAWGFDFSQRYPPHMSPYAKAKLGWVEPILIDSDGVYTITASYDTDMIYKIEEGFPAGEYLLIENRQRGKYDVQVPQGGLLIWHIDEIAEIDEEGHPGQMKWPHNGAHYKVALLQADGAYELEKGKNYGDGADPFHAGGVHSIGAGGTSNGKSHPNTDAYQNGNIYSTGITIDNISKSDYKMSFRYQKGNRDNDFSGVLQTFFFGGNGQAGIMFDVFANNYMTINGFDIHTSSTEREIVEIWSRHGSRVGYEEDEKEWIFRGAVTIRGQGPGLATRARDFEEIFLKKGETHGIYISFTERLLIYSNGPTSSKNSIIAQNEDLLIYDGAGVKYPFGSAYESRSFNGAIRYTLDD